MPRRLFAVVLLGVAGSARAAADSGAPAAGPPPGRLVTVEGARMHLHCTGAGSPVVVLEAGLGGMSAAWGWVQPEVARQTRTCAYDRAGLGWSEPAAGAADAAGTARRLRTLLQEAGEGGPYLLVGHSLGGMLVREFARRHPDEVAGMVLLDPVHPEMAAYLTPGAGRELAALFALTRIAPAAASMGLVRPGALLRPQIGSLPARDADALEWFLDSPGHLRAMRAEVRQWRAIARQAGAAGSPGDLPLLVLSAGDLPDDWRPGWAAMHRDLAALSPRGARLVVEDAGHASMIVEREPAGRVARIILHAAALSRGPAAGP